MLQHQLLMYPAALLFLLGLTPWMVDGFIRRSGLQRVLRVLTHPLGCALIFSLVVSLWHMPTYYDLALRHKVVHVVEHLMFFRRGAVLLVAGGQPVACAARRVTARRFSISSACSSR